MFMGLAFVILTSCGIEIGARTAQPARVVGIALANDSPRARLLADTRIASAPCPDLLTTMKAGKCDIIVADATPDNLKLLVEHPQVLASYTLSRGWLMLWGLTPEGLADFNKIVGLAQQLHLPIKADEILAPYDLDPLLTGLDRDAPLMMVNDKNGDLLPAGVTWSYVLDDKNITSLVSSTTAPRECDGRNESLRQDLPLLTVAKRSDIFLKKVTLLLSQGVLNKYPMGAGGIILNQMEVKADPLPVNREKQQAIVGTLLHNLIIGMDAQSSSTFQPPPVEEKNNAIFVDAIKRAICYAMAHQVPTVMFGARIYRISSTITIRCARNLTLQGVVKADGMPATILEEQIADSAAWWYQPLIFVAGTDITVRHLAFNCSKPTAMVAKIVEKGNNYVKIEALPRYREATETFTGDSAIADPGPAPSGFFSGFRLFDVQAGNPLWGNIGKLPGFIKVKQPFQFKKIPGTAYWETVGLTETPDVYVGEYINWEYQGGWQKGGVRFEQCHNPTAENLLGLNFPGAQACALYSTGTVYFKDLYSAPYDGYYTANRTSHNYMDYGHTFSISDHVVQVSSARDDSYDEDFIEYEVSKVIDPQTIVVTRVRNINTPPISTMHGCNANDEIWVTRDGLAHPYRCRLLEKPRVTTGPNGEASSEDFGKWCWIVLKLATPMPPEVLTLPTQSKDSVVTGPIGFGWQRGRVLVTRTFAERTWFNNCFDLRNGSGGWHHHSGSVVSENNFSLYEDLSYVSGTNGPCTDVGTYWNAIIRNNDYLSSSKYMWEGICVQDVGYRGGPDFPHVAITGNVFANRCAIHAYGVKNPLIDNNSWVGAKPRINKDESCLDPSISNNHLVTEDTTVNYLTNGDFAGGTIAPWTVEIGSASIQAGDAHQHNALKLPEGYHVLKAHITGLKENTYYRFGGNVTGDGLSFKVTDFVAPFGCALISESLTDSFLTFRTFTGITAVTLYITRRGGTGDALLRDLTLCRLNVTVPPVAPPPTFDWVPAPLPEDDGSYHMVDDIDPALHWSATGWEATPLTGITGSGDQDAWAYRNTLHQTKETGAGMTCTFTGTGIGLYAMRRPEYGSLSVQVDDGAPETVPLNTESDEQRLVYLKTGLPLGPHTLTVTHIDDQPINIDALRVLTAAKPKEN